MTSKVRQWFLLKSVGTIERMQEEAQRIRSWRLLQRAKSCGVGTTIWGESYISGIEHVEFGSNVHIGRGAYIRAEGGLVVGDNTHISRNLLLYTVNHCYEGSCLPYDHELIPKRVVVGRNVWIGMNVCIAPGSIVGDGAIIGMGTVVSGVVPPHSIIGSQKWRIIGKRNVERYNELDRLGFFGGSDGVCLKSPRHLNDHEH